MVTVASLLNPLSADAAPRPRRSCSPCSSNRFTPIEYITPPPTAPPESSPSTHRSTPTKPKQTKDAPSFVKGKPKGVVRYPAVDDVESGPIRMQMARMSLFPLGRIKLFARHIPYNSDKKDFQEKTGRESFEGEAMKA